MSSVASYFRNFEEYLVIFCIEKWKCIVADFKWLGLAAYDVMLWERNVLIKG